MKLKLPKTYVIGHINPDTDSIASAMGYAWLLNDQGDNSVLAARAGQLNPQTTWALQRLALESPLLLPDASPRFEAISHRFNTTNPDRPLREAWAVAQRTGGTAPVVNADGTPYGLVTGMSLFEFVGRLVGDHKNREGITMGDILDRPCKEACDVDVPKFQAGTRIRDVLPRILREERTAFWVVDEGGHYVGVCRQRDALNPPRIQVILVDHNEPGQAIGALDEADLLEVLDHHRLGNSSTHRPIRFSVDVVGSTSTLVSERIEEAGLSAPPGLAGMLLSGLISDTLLLSSPTTTPRDHKAADRLGRWAFVGGSPLEGETLESYGQQLLQSGSGLESRTADEIVHADFKRYEAGGMQFGISQVEVGTLVKLADHLQELVEGLVHLRDSNGLDFAMLMVTDVVRKESRLILTDEVPALDVLPYPRGNDQTLRAEGIVSRKMQLLPAVLGALEG